MSHSGCNSQANCSHEIFEKTSECKDDAWICHFVFFEKNNRRTDHMNQELETRNWVLHEWFMKVPVVVLVEILLLIATIMAWQARLTT
jgi:hypothetical protein